MPRRTNPHTWNALKESGALQERHVLMAMDLGMSAGSIMQEHARAEERGDLLLLEWVEDRFFAKHGHYAPISDATPENQAEHPAENSLLSDHDEAISKMLHIAHHTFSIHLISQTDSRYLGMVCHFNKCPKHKFECRIPGCGANRFVQILPWYRLKPRRLNEFNSQILFQRPT